MRECHFKKMKRKGGKKGAFVYYFPDQHKAGLSQKLFPLQNIVLPHFDLSLSDCQKWLRNWDDSDKTLFGKSDETMTMTINWKRTIKSGIMNQPSARQFLWVREEQRFCLACISAYLWSVKRDPKQRLDSASENVATETGPRVWRQVILFTCLYNSINTVGMPGKSKSSRTLRVHECVHDFFFLLHVQNCVLINVCAETKSPSTIPKVFFVFPPTASHYNRPWTRCLFSFPFPCLPSSSYGCVLHSFICGPHF